MSRTSPRTDPRPGSRSCASRLRRRLFAASAALMLALCALVSAWLLAAGAEAGDLLAPLAGAILALAAELLCVDVAIRRVQRRLEPDTGSRGAPRRAALGV